jgi:hypothetical protein
MVVAHQLVCKCNDITMWGFSMVLRYPILPWDADVQHEPLEATLSRVNPK